jgi:hypothetical protein
MRKTRDISSEISATAYLVSDWLFMKLGSSCSSENLALHQEHEAGQQSPAYYLERSHQI